MLRQGVIKNNHRYYHRQLVIILNIFLLIDCHEILPLFRKGGFNVLDILRSYFGRFFNHHHIITPNSSYFKWTNLLRFYFVFLVVFLINTIHYLVICLFYFYFLTPPPFCYLKLLSPVHVVYLVSMTVVIEDVFL